MQIAPKIEEVKRGLEVTNIRFDEKLQAERDLMANRFDERSENLENQF